MARPLPIGTMERLSLIHISLQFIGRFFQHSLQRRNNQGKRCTQFMADVREETDTDIKGKQERNMENEIKSEIKKDIETERERKDGKES